MKQECPICRKGNGVIYGTEPANGTMPMTRKESSLPGYYSHGTISIHYDLPDGVQTVSACIPVCPYECTHPPIRIIMLCTRPRHIHVRAHTPLSMSRPTPTGYPQAHTRTRRPAKRNINGVHLSSGYVSISIFNHVNRAHYEVDVSGISYLGNHI